MPASGAYRNNTQVSFTFSDNCSSASITWVRTGGAADAGGAPAGTHTQALTGPELLSGAHNNITLTNNPTLADGAIYTVTFACTDMAMNVLSPVVATSVTYDTTLPVITVAAPTASSYRTTTNVDYTLSEACSSGSVTWTQTGGTADPGSPRVQALSSAELASGAHSNITLANNPALVDGAVYSVAFNCTDLAGNVATTITRTNVTYDFTTPVISSVSPANGSVLNHKQVGFTFSEACAGANITWTRTGGIADGSSPHVQALTGPELNAGSHGPAAITNNPPLVSGTVYDITFNCTDAAGLVATAVTVTSVTFDNVTPVISAVQPLDSTFVSTTQVTYDLTENCASASITWTRTGGSADGSSPHNQALTAGELTAGLHSAITITNNPTLISGAIYSMAFNCTDAAGNAATAVTRTNVTYDSVGPAISAVSPSSSAFVNNKLVNYTLSEDCQTGQVQWLRTGGTADGGSPHNMALAGGQLLAGAHTGINLNPTIVDGAVYQITFSCTDFAANAATPIVLTGVTYDVTVPVISGVSPASSTAVNNQQISYTFSEACATATVNWTYVSGTASSSFNQGLTGGELTSGAHGPAVIASNPALVSGATYNIVFNCADAAGNAAVAVTQTNVTYDFTPPTISIQNLRDKSMVHTGHVIGIANDPVGTMLNVQFQLDGGTWTAATYTAPNWKFALPMGASTWKDRSPHTINVRATDTAGNITTNGVINVRKGNNRDINGDGYEDFAVSAHLHNTNIGGIYVYYGMPGTKIPDNTTGSAPLILGATANDYYGRQSAMGDFNGDGFADLAVGSPGNTTTLPGNVKIYHGAGIGLNTTPALTLTGENNQDRFGGNIQAADMDNDGYADLAVGANGFPNFSSQGKVYIYRSAGASGINSGFWKTITGQAAPAANQFGGGIAIGDFDNDTNADIAIAAPAFNNGAANDGRVYRFTNIQSLAASTNAAAGDALVTGVASSAENMGASLTAGDFNGDGISDLLIGSLQWSANSGRAYVHHGAAGTGLNASPAGTISGLGNPTYFTTSMSARDMNVDGYDDILIGGHGNGTQTGKAYIFFGQAAALGSINTGSGGVFTITGENTMGFFGRGVSAADVNGDGYPDMLVGAPKHNTSRGRMYVAYGTVSGPTITVANNAANTIFDGNTAPTATSEYATAFNR